MNSLTRSLRLCLILAMSPLSCCTAAQELWAPMRTVYAECDSSACLTPRQLIRSDEAERMKRYFGDRALFIDIRGRGEAPASRRGIVVDATVAFMDGAPVIAANPGVEIPHPEFRIDFTYNVDEILRARHGRHDDPLIVIAPTVGRAVLAALLLQEHGYSKVFVVRD